MSRTRPCFLTAELILNRRNTSRSRVLNQSKLLHGQWHVTGIRKHNFGMHCGAGQGTWALITSCRAGTSCLSYKCAYYLNDYTIAETNYGQLCSTFGTLKAYLSASRPNSGPLQYISYSSGIELRSVVARLATTRLSSIQLLNPIPVPT